MVANIARQMTADTSRPFCTFHSISIVISFTKHAAASVSPSSIDTRNSFHKTFHMSLKVTSPRAMPRMIVTDACDPAFPPVSISIGIQAVNIMP